MNKSAMLYKEIHERMIEKWFLKQMGMSEEQMEELLSRGFLPEIAEAIAGSADDRGRFSAKKTAEAADVLLDQLTYGTNSYEPDDLGHDSRLQNAYNYVLGNLFRGPCNHKIFSST